MTDVGRDARLLMVNGLQAGCPYIPMGSLGICDYLRQRGIEARIFTGSAYGPNAYLAVLKRTIEAYRPDCVGLILHWKELLGQCIFLGDYLKRLMPGVPLVVGGITAGYFAEELLGRFRAFDFVIRGDPEEPLRRLLKGEAAAGVPNLVYRAGSRVQRSADTFVIDQATLNTLSYTDLSCLYDAEKYLAEINRALGFPVFLGRGCPYHCAYCGGSRRAFVAHSGREAMVHRDIDAVLRDLRALLRHTDTIYIGHEPSVGYILDLFGAIAEDPELGGRFRLNYGAWHLVTEPLIELYLRAFRFDARQPSILEISPEVAGDDDQRAIKDSSLAFGTREMMRAIASVCGKANGGVRVHVFYSRYHKTARSREALRREFSAQHAVEEELFCVGRGRVTVMHSHLATDPGSEYWDLAMRAAGDASGIDVLLQASKRTMGLVATEVRPTNLCIYAPEELGERDKEVFERMMTWADALRKAVPEFYFLVMKVLGASRVAGIWEGIIDAHVKRGEGYVLGSMSPLWVIDRLQRAARRRYPRVYARHAGYLNGLFGLYRRCMANTYQQLEPRDGCLAERPVLNRKMVFVTEYDYTGESVMRVLRDGVGSACRRRTVNVLVGRRVHTFDVRHWRALRRFNGRNTEEEVHRMIRGDDGFDEGEAAAFTRFMREYAYYFTE